MVERITIPVPKVIKIAEIPIRLPIVDSDFINPVQPMIDYISTLNRQLLRRY